MIIDTSAVVAILRAEPEAAACAKAIEAASERRMSAANFLEAAVVLDSARDPVVSRRFDELVTAAQITVEPVTEAQARIAREAYRDFGKGSGHPAGLDFGTALPTPWPGTPASRCWSRATTSPTPTSPPRSPAEAVMGRWSWSVRCRCFPGASGPGRGRRRVRG